MANKHDYDDDDLLNDEEIDVEEGHDPMNAETKSNDSVDKAAKTGPTAKKRHADKTNMRQGTAEKPNKGFVRELYDLMQSMTKEEVRKLHDVLMDENFDIDQFVEGKTATLDDVQYDMQEDIADLVKSEATLSEGFKDKAGLIMEMAVKSKVSEEIARLEESYEEQLNEAVDAATDELVEKVDSYLNYVVENWMEENKLAVNAGIRTEIAENFMNGLKDLFVESYISVPEEQVDLVDDLSEQNASLEADVNELMSKMIDMREALEGYEREAIIFEFTDDLADTQVDKLVKLSENVDFDDAESFREAMATIKETYFGKKTSNTQSRISEDAAHNGDDVDEVEVSASMQNYVTALRKSK